MTPWERGSTSEEWPSRTTFVPSTRYNDECAHATASHTVNLILNEADLDKLKEYSMLGEELRQKRGTNT